MILLYVLSTIVSAITYVVTWRLRRPLRSGLAIGVFFLLAVLPTVIWLTVADPPPAGAETYSPEQVANPE
jgi:4-amino-4-deoxy-L-arabinose transferase-like glycosyltransferase